jgi:hypothetical protein
MTTFKLPLWHDAELNFPLLVSRGLSHLEGSTEYRIRVEGPTYKFERLVAKVTLLHPSKEPVEALADTTTGQLYVDGVCQSGVYRMVGIPHKTGRNVPDLAKRQFEALGRCSMMEFGDTPDET